jgi:membrane protease YdiL (CAAX protease family)
VSKTLGLYALGFIAAVSAAAFPSFAWISPIAFLLILPLGAFWIWRGQGRRIGDLGFATSHSRLRYLAFGLLVGLGVPILFLAIQRLAGWIALEPRGAAVSDFVAYLPPLLVRMILVVAIEELIFRGFFPVALSREVGIWGAMLLSSFLWGASHVGAMVHEGLAPGSITIAMATFLVWGIMLSLCYLIAEKSLWLPYGIHLGVNIGFSLAGLYFITQPSAPTWLIGHPAWSPESGLIGTVVWLVILLLAYWLTGSSKLAQLAESQ